MVAEQGTLQIFSARKGAMESSHQSEIAKIREQIQLEYEAAQRTFTDFTPTAQHAYISKRQENISRYFAELKTLLPEQDAIALVVDALESVQSNVSSGKIS